LEQATDAFRLFREQPTPELAQSAREGVRSALSPNDRLQQLYHPWTSYLIVPLFALANAGIVVSGGFLARAFTSPVTLGILAGYLLDALPSLGLTPDLRSKKSLRRCSWTVGWGLPRGKVRLKGIVLAVSRRLHAR